MDKIVLKIAKDAILQEFQNITIDKKNLIKKYPFLNEEGATFVTLTKKGKLRGCIGSIIAFRKLIDDIIENAKSSAFRDTRFLPLSKEELKYIEIEVSLLTKPELIEYRDKEELKKIIKPFKDGIIVKLNGYQATFLPQVWEQLPNFEDFFKYLGDKAGVGTNILDYHPEVYRYRVQKIKD